MDNVKLTLLSGRCCIVSTPMVMWFIWVLLTANICVHKCCLYSLNIKKSFHMSLAGAHIWTLAEWVWRRSMRMWSWLENTPCWGTTALRWSVIRGSWSRSENTSTQSETPLYSRNGSRLEFLPGYCSHCLKVWFRLFNLNAFVCSCCLIQVWQEINEETKQVQEIMATLESFQLESTPSKPSSFVQENDIMPVHVEHRYMSTYGFILNLPNSHQRFTQTLLPMQ